MSETAEMKLFKHDNPSQNESLFDVTKALNENWDKIENYVVGNEQIREENEKTRVQNETDRKLAEAGRVEAEQTRNSSEKVREKAEESRATAETARDTAEQTRQANEETRKTTEEARVGAENERAKAEELRETSEVTREEQEKERKANEELRKTAETARDTAEQDRNTNEETRQTNEQVRQANEEDRKQAETEREAYYTEIQEKVNRGDFKGDPNVLKIGTVTQGSEPSADITGDSPNQTLNLVLPKGDKGDKGEKGDTGNGIESIELTNGNHTAGTLDTYTITYTDKTTDEMQVYNGKDGEGAGDMEKATYDKDNDGIVDNAQKVNGHTVETDVPEGAKFTDTIYDDTTIKGQINNKVDKVEGKGLSTVDFTTEYETKLKSLSNYDDTAIKADIKTAKDTADSALTKANANTTALDNKVDKEDGKSLSTNNYNDLSNIPKINGITLKGNQTGKSLKLDDEYKPTYIKDYELESNLWQNDLESNKYYYLINAEGITTNHRVNIYMTLENQAKLVDGETDTKDGEIYIYTSEQPTEAVTVNLEITLTKEGTISK